MSLRAFALSFGQAALPGIQMGFQRANQRAEDRRAEERQDAVRAEEREYQAGQRQAEWNRQDAVRAEEQIRGQFHNAKSPDEVETIWAGLSEEQRGKYGLVKESSLTKAAQVAQDRRSAVERDKIELKNLQDEQAKRLEKEAARDKIVNLPAGAVLEDPLARRMLENELNDYLSKGDYDQAGFAAQKLGGDFVGRVAGLKQKAQAKEDIATILNNPDMGPQAMWEIFSKIDPAVAKQVGGDVVRGMIFGGINKRFSADKDTGLSLALKRNDLIMKQGGGEDSPNWISDYDQYARKYASTQQNSQLNNVMTKVLGKARTEANRVGLEDPEDRWKIAAGMIEEHPILSQAIGGRTSIMEQIRPRFEEGFESADRPFGGGAPGGGAATPQGISDTAYEAFGEEQDRALGTTPKEKEATKLKEIGRSHPHLANNEDWEFYLRYHANPPDRTLPPSAEDQSMALGGVMPPPKENPDYERWQRIKSTYGRLAQQLLGGGGATPVDAGINFGGAGQKHR